ncbi:MAG: tetratricopeptide repeat protein [Bacteroidota bacterium]
MNESRLAQLKALLDAEPNDPFLIYGIAQEYIAGGIFPEAKSWFEKLVAEHPDYVPAYYHFGLCLYRLEEDERAFSVWRKGVEVAQAAGNRKTALEIKELLADLADEEDEW